jgi:hypothetical protein
MGSHGFMQMKYLYFTAGTVGKCIPEMNQFTLYRYKNAGSCTPAQGTKVTKLLIAVLLMYIGR